MMTKKVFEVLRNGQVSFIVRFQGAYFLNFSTDSVRVGLWIMLGSTGFQVLFPYYVSEERAQVETQARHVPSDVVELSKSDREIVEDLLKEKVDEIKRVIFSEML